MLPGSDPELVRRALPALRALAEAPAGTRMLWAHAASGDYPVFAGPAMLETGFFPVEGRRHCVSDTTVFELHGRHLEPLAGSVLVEPGEQSKTLASAEQVWRALAQLLVGFGTAVGSRSGPPWSAD